MSCKHDTLYRRFDNYCCVYCEEEFDLEAEDLTHNDL